MDEVNNCDPNFDGMSNINLLSSLTSCQWWFDDDEDMLQYHCIHDMTIDVGWLEYVRAIHPYGLLYVTTQHINFVNGY